MMVENNSRSILSIYTDGGSRGNPGPAAVGIALFINGEEILSAGRIIGIQTNNVAEYQAFLDSLAELPTQLENQSISEIRWFLDSKLVVEQLSGRWKVKDSGLKELWKECNKQLDILTIPYTIHHIPRENNVLADKMVNQALDDLA